MSYRLGVAKKSDPEFDPAPAIPFHNGSNGEFIPSPPGGSVERARRVYKEIVDDRSRRLGVSRRRFMASTCGAATTLYVANLLAGCGGSAGSGVDGGFNVDADSTLDGAKACEELGGDEFIFDVQTHHVNPEGAWRDAGTVWPFVLGGFPQGSCGDADPVDCFDVTHYIREMFINSDTSVAVLTAVPAVEDENPLVAAEQKETADLVRMMSGSPRLLTHGLVSPDLGQAQLDGMERLVNVHEIAAWKAYTQLGGWWLDDSAGIAFIEKARSLDVKTICVHKGLTLPLPGFSSSHSDPRDMAVVAKAYSDVNFVVYHSGYEESITEGAYNAASPQGVDTLVRAINDESIAPGSNLYAELGSTWRNVMLTNDDQAAHVLGKLLLAVGEDRLLWGTDSIWYGSPQDQIMAFRAFQIPEALRAAHGYPELTPAIKAKILGLNAAQLYGVDPTATLCEIKEDQLALRKQELPERPAPSFRDYGPVDRREFFAFLRSRGGTPG